MLSFFKLLLAVIDPVLQSMMLLLVNAHRAVNRSAQAACYIVVFRSIRLHALDFFLSCLINWRALAEVPGGVTLLIKKYNLCAAL